MCESRVIQQTLLRSVPTSILAGYCWNGHEGFIKILHSFVRQAQERQHDNFVKTNQVDTMTISTYSEGGHPRPRANSRNKQNKTTAATQVSGASNAGFLGNARSKLKGYLGSFKSKEDPDTSRLQSGAEGTNLLDIKTPKYRHYSSSSKSPATDAVTKNCPRQITSDQSPFTDSEDGEGKSHTYSVKTKYYDKEASSISSKKSKKKLTKKNSNEKKLSKKIDRPKTDDQKIHMFDLPWSDNRPNSRLQGWY
eukprot:scaffold55148_cov49-Cyclotella_meneghiniana.AAC.3